jgi:transcriptional regulator with XRE-family HTH domain
MATKKKVGGQAPKSLYRPENQVFLTTLRALREKTGFNQTDFAGVLGRSQTYVSSAERGAVRLDGLQLKDWCRACGVSLVVWATEIEKQLGVDEPKPKGRASVRKAVKPEG